MTKNHNFSSFCSLKVFLFYFHQSRILQLGEQLIKHAFLTLAQTTNFRFNKNGEKVLQKGRKHSGKRRNCSLRAISPFPTLFSKDLYCRLIKAKACLGKG